jgi:hypothetical protein
LLTASQLMRSDRAILGYFFFCFGFLFSFFMLVPLATCSPPSSSDYTVRLLSPATLCYTPPCAGDALSTARRSNVTRADVPEERTHRS